MQNTQPTKISKAVINPYVKKIDKSRDLSRYLKELLFSHTGADKTDLYEFEPEIKLDSKDILSHFNTFFSSLGSDEQEKLIHIFCDARSNKSGDLPAFFSNTDRSAYLFFLVATQNKISGGLFSKSEVDYNFELEAIMLQNSPIHTNSLIRAQIRLLNSHSFSEQDRLYLTQIQAVLSAPTSSDEDVILTIINGFHPKTLSCYDNYQKLIHLCTALMRLNGWHLSENSTHVDHYQHAIVFLKNNPNSGFAHYIQEKHSIIVKNLFDAEVLKKQTGRSQPLEISFIDINSDEFFAVLNLFLIEKVSFKLSLTEQFIYAEKLGMTEWVTLQNGRPPTEMISKDFETLLKKFEAEAKSLLLQKNSQLIDNPHAKRSADDRFINNASVAKQIKTAAINGNALVNQYDQKESNSAGELLTTRLRCGSVHSQNAARQYVLKMLLENTVSQADNTIYLIDSRYLDSLVPKAGDAVKLTKHRAFIHNVLNEILLPVEEKGSFVIVEPDEEIDTSLTPPRNCINIEKVQNMIQQMKEDGLLCDDVEEKIPADFFQKLQNKEICFISLDLGPTSEHGIARKDVKTIQELPALLDIFKAHLISLENGKIHCLLTEFEEIITQEKMRDYIAGFKAFHLDEIIHQLSKESGFVTSSGCFSNKDRGSSAYMFHRIVDSIMKYREENGVHNFSIKNFDLCDEIELQIARDIIMENEVFTVTLLNTGTGGSKCNRLQWLIKKAFGCDSDVKAYVKLQSSSKKVAH